MPRSVALMIKRSATSFDGGAERIQQPVNSVRHFARYCYLAEVRRLHCVAASDRLQAAQQKNADQSYRDRGGERNPSAIVAGDALGIRPTNFCGKRVDCR
jgi:hypothetical protein